MTEETSFGGTGLGQWQRMSMARGGSGVAAAAAAAFDSLPPAPQFAGLLGNRRFLQAVGVTAFLLFVAVVLRRGGGASDAALTAASVDGAELWRRIAETTAQAAAAGLLHPIATTFEIAEDGGVPFILSLVDASSAASKDGKATYGTAAPAGPDYDPFGRGRRDPRMVAAEAPPDHVLVLNKFPTMSGHVLLVTDGFQPQWAALTLSDFRAWFRLVEALPAVGFFNSAAEAGASQKHKHMQLIPMETLASYVNGAGGDGKARSGGGGYGSGHSGGYGSGYGDGYDGAPWDPMPVSAAVAARVGDSRDFERVWHVPQYTFEHGVVLLPTRQEWAHLVARGGGAGPDSADGGGGDDGGDGYYRHLLGQYHALLAAVGFDAAAVRGAAAEAEALAKAAAAAATTAVGAVADLAAPTEPTSAATLPPYNLLLTSRYMMAVPRTQREFVGVDVNGMGFFGALLARDERTREVILDVGGLEILKGVTLPRRRG
ncbi:unnamed protein product [Phaeothamnion confervicola]